MARPLFSWIAVILSLLGGCSDPQPLSWGFRFTESAPRGDACQLEAEIRRGGCDGAAIYVTELAPGQASMDQPPELEPGCYGFYGRARDSACCWYAEGCVEACLPEETGRIEVPLSEPEGRPMCEPGCAVGTCGVPDAGPGDGGPRDGGPVDAPPDIDSGCTENCGQAACVDGTCQCPGTLDLVRDEGRIVCTDLSSDPDSCGSGGEECNDSEYCVDGSCRCRPGLTDVSGVCRDLETDPSHCGSPGAMCDSGTMITCRGGTCEDSCNTADGQTNCSNACVDLMRDPQHCGSCIASCSRDEVCVSGSCEQYRPAVDLSSGEVCDACPCSCGDGNTCCAYGGNVICVDAGSCP